MSGLVSPRANVNEATGNITVTRGTCFVSAYYGTAFLDVYSGKMNISGYSGAFQISPTPVVSILIYHDGSPFTMRNGDYMILRQQ